MYLTLVLAVHHWLASLSQPVFTYSKSVKVTIEKGVKSKFWCYHCRLWTNKYWLGLNLCWYEVLKKRRCLFICEKKETAGLNSQKALINITGLGRFVYFENISRLILFFITHIIWRQSCDSRCNLHEHSIWKNIGDDTR